MIFRYTIVRFVVGLMLLSETSFAAGPATNPDSFPDWGGTKDITGSEDMGLTAEELYAVLERLASGDVGERTAALDDLMKSAPGSEAVFRKALFDGRGLKNTEMKNALKTAQARGAGDTQEGLLKALVAMEPSEGVRGALRMTAMLHALSSLDTMAAYKTMIEFSPRHAGVFRQEVGRMLCAHKMDAMPALIYGRGSKNPEIHMFAVKWIRDLGDPLLSDQVKIENPRRLAQLLEAYASVNDLDTIDVILAATNHSSSFVRAAARASVAAFGRNAFWPARRQYENTFGTEPDDAATVESILAALYQHYDTRRLAESQTLFNKGRDAFRAGRLDEMEKAYREVLKNEPMFPKKAEMAEGFSTLADACDDDEADKKEAALMMVLRVLDDETTPLYRSAEARLLWLRSAPFREKGLAEPKLYKRILALQPDFKDAAMMVDRLQPNHPSKMHIIYKTILVSLLIFAAGLLIVLRLKRAK